MIAIPRYISNLSMAYDSKLETNGFTMGKQYPVIREEGNGLVVRNDNGYERFILKDGSRSPHLNEVFKKCTDMFRTIFNTQRPIGYFEVIA